MLPTNNNQPAPEAPPTKTVRLIHSITHKTRNSKAFTALVAITLLVPAYAYAGLFSFFGSRADAQNKSDIHKNSQTLVLTDPSTIVSSVIGGGNGSDVATFTDDDTLSTDIGPMGTIADIDEYVPDSDQISL